MMHDAQVVQVENELSIVARSRPAERHFTRERGQSQPRPRLMDTTGRDEERECG